MKLPFDAKGLADKALGALPEMSLPTLGSEAEIPVYLIHNSPDAEDYFFLFDFETFVDRSKSGMFVRPKLQLWAGRDDFDRVLLARQFRQSFAAEFDRMRAELGSRKSDRGWLTWDFGLDLAGQALSDFVAYLVILIAVGAGKALTSLISLPDWMKGRSAEAKVEDKIDDLKGRVDTALERIDLTLHRDLYLHAYKGQPGGATAGLDYDAWPLPAHVTEHLQDKTSGSWW